MKVENEIHSNNLYTGVNFSDKHRDILNMVISNEHQTHSPHIFFERGKWKYYGSGVSKKTSNVEADLLCTKLNNANTQKW